MEEYVILFRHTAWLIIFFMFFSILEAFSNSQKNNKKNLLINIIYSYLNRFIDWAVIIVVFATINAIGFQGHIIDVSNESIIVQVLTILLVVDLITYFTHRLMHKYVWGLHSVHHNSSELNWHSSYRSHPLNHTIAAIVLTTTFSLIIASPYLGITMIAVSAYTNFIHSSHAFSYGKLDKFFVSPLIHHWHHSKSDKGKDKNFAGVFSFYDVIFGTFYKENKKPDEYGVEAPNYSKSSIVHHTIEGIRYQFKKR